MIPIEQLRELLLCDPENGTLTWKVRPGTDRCTKWWNTRYAGKPAMTAIGNHGYHFGNIHNKTVLAHRVVWAICIGQWPPCEVDHINGIRTDNSLANLRSVSRAENAKNTRARIRKSGLPCGVYEQTTSKGRYRADIQIGGKRKTVGCFGSIEEARAAYLAAIKDAGFSARHGRPSTRKVST